MHAQVIRNATTRETRAELERIVCRELIPALRAEPGFAGAMNLVDSQTGVAMTIVLWKSSDDAERLLRRSGPRLVQALARLSSLSADGPPRVSVWEVGIRI